MALDFTRRKKRVQKMNVDSVIFDLKESLEDLGHIIKNIRKDLDQVLKIINKPENEEKQI